MANSEKWWWFVYAVVSEAKAPESNDFECILPGLSMMFLATKLSEFSRCPRSIGPSLPASCGTSA